MNYPKFGQLAPSVLRDWWGFSFGVLCGPGDEFRQIDSPFRVYIKSFRLDALALRRKGPDTTTDRAAQPNQSTP